MSYASMSSPCLSLGLDLQCFTRLGKMVQRFIDTLSEISCVTHVFEAALRSHGRFSCLRDPTTSDQYVLFPTCLKIFRILSMNLIHLVTVSYHQVCQERQFQTQVSLLFLTFYAKATIDSEPPR